MGRQVNVVLPSGRVVAVDEDVAKASQLSRDTVAQEAGGVTSDINEERSSGLVEGVKAAAEGAADTATLGLYGAARGVLDPEGARDMRIRAQERSGSRWLGEMGAMALPGLGEAGRLGEVGGALAEATAPGLARSAGKVFGGKVGTMVEGGILGSGAYIAETNVTGDPLSIEALTANATVGGIMNLGFEVAANKLEGSVWKGKTAAAKAAIRSDEINLAKKGVGAFNDTPPSWDEFVELHKAKRDAISTYNKQVAKEAAEYADALTPEGLNKTMSKFDDARSEILSDVQGDPDVRAAMEAHNTANKAYEKTQKRWNKHIEDNKFFTDKLNKMQDIISAKRDEFAPRGAPDNIHRTKTVGVQGAVDGNGRFIKAPKNAVFKTGTPKAVISEALDSSLKGYAEELSQIMRQKGGGYRLEGGKWIKDANVPADPEGALVRANELSKKMAQHFGGKGVPSFPVRPVEPVTPDVAIRPEVQSKVQTARELGEATNSARTLMRQGKFEDAQNVLANAKAKLADVAGDRLPTMAGAPRDPLPDVAGELPKKLEDFSRKHTSQITEMAQNMADPQTQASLYRVMKDLDLKATGNTAEDFAALHRTLGNYRRAMTSLAEAEAKRAAAEATQPKVLKILKQAIKLAAGRTADVGGALGGMTRTIGQSAVMRGVGAVENAAFGAAVMEARGGIRQRVRDLVTKYGQTGADTLRKLGAPTTYLKSGFITGEKDKSNDIRTQAINRANEIQAAAMAAPDAAFLAVSGMLGHPDDIAWKMHQHVVGTLNYLASTLPRDPGTNTKLFSSNWSPAYHEAVAMAHRLEAVNDPLTAIARAIGGDSHPAATEALWAIYPAVMNELAQELSIAAPQMKKLTYEQASAYSNLFRTPLTGLQQPVVFNAIQGMYMQSPGQSAPPNGRPSAGKPKQAPGRPAAVQSPVAGSSPGALTGS